MIKSYQVFLLSFFSVLLMSCGMGNSNTDSVSSNNSSSTSGVTNPQGAGSSSTITVKIPSTPGPLPRGAFEQVSFSPGGGLGECSEICYDEGAFRGNVLRLSKFSPNQQLKLLVYSDPGGKYQTTWHVQVDKYGSLTIKLSNGDFSSYGIYIHDSKSGRLLRMTRVMGPREVDGYSGNSESCPGAPPKRLSVGKGAIVCTKSDTVNLRTSPNKESSTTHRLVPGAELQIIGGPVCDKQASWWYWKVKTESGFEGWMAEGGDSIDQYFLCPTK